MSSWDSSVGFTGQRYLRSFRLQEFLRRFQGSLKVSGGSHWIISMRTLKELFKGASLKGFDVFFEGFKGSLMDHHSLCSSKVS